MLGLAVVALGALLLLTLVALALALMRLHDVEETVALHELALGHLTQPVRTHKG